MFFGVVARTLLHLRFSQLVAQAHNRVRVRFEAPSRLLNRDAPAWPGLRWDAPSEGWLPPSPLWDGAAADIDSGTFRFVNQARALGRPVDWVPDGAGALWRYNLHYLEWLWALDAERVRAAVLDWIDHVPPCRGSVAWSPYPTSLRLMNLCALCFARDRHAVLADTVFRDAVWSSVWRQAQRLSSRLEYHLLGNHLLENAAALALVGACFKGSAAARWRTTGLRLLRRELAEQILDDGVHFERSPMYQCRVAYALALLSQTRDAQVRSIVDPPLERVCVALAQQTHPDGRIALFNDAALGVYQSPEQLLRWSRRLLSTAAPLGVSLPAGVWAQRAAGYYGSRTDAGNYVICDAGVVGPDYIPGHAHADIFSFELSFDGRRIVSDAGVHDYEQSTMRSYCRSTRAHNTVEVDGADQCELWGAFRVGRRGVPRGVHWESSRTGFRLSGAHDGYRSQPGRPTHAREFVWDDRGVLLLRDKVESGADTVSVSRIHLAPGLNAVPRGDDGFFVEEEGGKVLATVVFAGPKPCVDEGLRCLEFHTVGSCAVLAQRAHGPHVTLCAGVLQGRYEGSLCPLDGVHFGGDRLGW